jgi:hypothetical protein
VRPAVRQIINVSSVAPAILRMSVCWTVDHNHARRAERRNNPANFNPPECKEEVLVYLVECAEHVPGLRMFMEEHIWAQEAFTPLNTMSLQFGVRCFGLLYDWNVGIGILPEREKVFICSFRFRDLIYDGVGAT